MLTNQPAIKDRKLSYKIPAKSADTSAEPAPSRLMKKIDLKFQQLTFFLMTCRRPSLLVERHCAEMPFYNWVRPLKRESVYCIIKARLYSTRLIKYCYYHNLMRLLHWQDPNPPTSDLSLLPVAKPRFICQFKVVVG